MVANVKNFKDIFKSVTGYGFKNTDTKKIIANFRKFILPFVVKLQE
jgi:hypothetical protein